MTNHPMRGICFWIGSALTLLNPAGLVAARPHAPQGTMLWQQTLSGTANSNDQALSVAVDNQGNVVAAGVTTGFTVAKFSR